MVGRGFEIDDLSPERRRVRSWFLDADAELRTRLAVEEIRGAFEGGRGTLWVDIDARSDEAWGLLGSIFGFHPLAIEDTRSPHGRVKVDDYGDYIFVTARGLRFAEETPEPYDIETSDRHFFLGAHALVTVHEGFSRSVERVAEWAERAPEATLRSADHVFYLVLDQIVDHYFPVLEAAEDFIDTLEDEIVREAGPGVMPRLFALKRALIALRRHLAPQRELVLALATRPSRLLAPETQLFFRDVYDHVVRQVEQIEMMRDLLSSALETNLTLVSNRVNEVMKALSIIATVVLPPTLIASIYGMNFSWLPFATEPWGFWFALALMVSVSAAFLLFVKQKDWL